MRNDDMVMILRPRCFRHFKVFTNAALAGWLTQLLTGVTTPNVKNRTLSPVAQTYRHLKGNRNRLLQARNAGIRPKRGRVAQRLFAQPESASGRPFLKQFENATSRYPGSTMREGIREEGLAFPVPAGLR